ncbi:hypothetical protein BpHYR1_048374 [Brachionus plicatilis]|uniref:Uncharacterized protein n=1 Tax=Brachionus plicatilis TaxID=10195 RepID=A0A3M7QFI1_BRAPC|nr:hypothetical protein BpHYR1_048374 [Brachionus plicatilis]
MGSLIWTDNYSNQIIFKKSEFGKFEIILRIKATWLRSINGGDKYGSVFYLKTGGPCFSNNPHEWVSEINKAEEKQLTIVALSIDFRKAFYINKFFCDQEINVDVFNIFFLKICFIQLKYATSKIGTNLVKMELKLLQLTNSEI